MWPTAPDTFIKRRVNSCTSAVSHMLVERRPAVPSDRIHTVQIMQLDV